MNTTLCFDFGNTRLKCGVFTNGQLTEVLSLADTKNETIELLLKKYQPARTILSSVIEHNASIEKILAKGSSFHKLSSQSILPFTAPVSKPETIGADRLALAAGAVYFYKEKNNLVIALGSCVTYNFINKYHSFLGGSISPGMEMRFKALELFTSKLPLVQPHWNFPLLGYDTKTNIQSGVIFGMAKEIEGMIEAYEDRYENLHTVMTGGDAHYFMPYLKRKITEDPDLLFKGLYTISEYNFSN